jgi:hypothetical protein
MRALQSAVYTHAANHAGAGNTHGAKQQNSCGVDAHNMLQRCIVLYLNGPHTHTQTHTHTHVAH